MLHPGDVSHQFKHMEANSAPPMQSMIFWMKPLNARSLLTPEKYLIEVKA